MALIRRVAGRPPSSVARASLLEGRRSRMPARQSGALKSQNAFRREPRAARRKEEPSSSDLWRSPVAISRSFPKRREATRIGSARQPDDVETQSDDCEPEAISLICQPKQNCGEPNERQQDQISRIDFLAAQQGDQQRGIVLAIPSRGETM